MVRLLLLSVLLLLPTMAYGEWYEWIQENGVMAYSNQEVPEKYDRAYAIHGQEYLKDYTLKNYSKYTEVECYAYTKDNADVDRSCATMRDAERNKR